MGWIRRLRSTLASRKVDETFEEEARFHLDQRIAEYLAAGMTPERARDETRRRFGGLALSRERARDADTLPWLRDAGQDVRLGARLLRRNRGFALAALLILAIGIGTNTALFTVIDELLLEQLPVDAPHELVLFDWLEGRKGMRFGMDGIRTTDAATGRSTSTSFSYPTFLRLRDANRTLTQLFAFFPVQQLNLVVDGRADVASGQYASGNYFKGLGVGAHLGRTFTDHDDRPGATPVATISHRFWQRRFDGDPRIVGRTVTINRIAITIVGVTPPKFEGALEVTQSADVTMPFAAEPLLEGDRSELHRPAFLWVRLMGRLRLGVTREQVAGNLNGPMQHAMLDEWRQVIATGDERGDGDSIRTLDDASTLRVGSGSQGLMDSRERYARPLLLLMACGALVLVVTCLNLANLLLSRGAARHREIATRLALGARRGRLVRQLFTESLLLAGAGSLCGLALAWWGTDLLLIWRPWGGAIALENAFSWRVLGFSGAVTVVTAALFGLTPALRATRADLSHFTRRTAGGSSRLARVLVIAQVAVSVVLLVAAALFVGTLRNLGAVDIGFNADRLLLFRIQPQLNGYEAPARSALYDRLIERIGTIPGVQAVTVSRHPLLASSRRADGVTLEGVSAPADNSTEINIVAANYLPAMGIPLVLGRGFEDRDGEAAPKVAIVNQRFASSFFPGSHPIGRRFWFGEQQGDAIEIVGVARDAKYTDLRNPTRPIVYVPIRQEVPGQVNVAVRTAGEPLALAPAVREVVRAIDPNLPIFDVKSQVDQARESVARETAFARLSSLLGAIALLLVAVGLYGTMSYAVVRRTAEIGVRMALGAPRTTVVAMVLRDALVMAGVGLAIGIPAALAASRGSRTLLDELLFGLEPTDLRVVGFAVVALLVVALLAGLLPARHASRVDPVIALQAE